MPRGDQYTIKQVPGFVRSHFNKSRHQLYMGTAGSGKSMDVASQTIRRVAMGGGKRNAIVVRKSEISHTRSTFNELMKAISAHRWQHVFRAKTKPLQIDCVNGGQILFVGVNNANEREKLKSITARNGNITDAWVEEATELQQADYEIIGDRLRGKLDDGLFYQIKNTFNPISSTHWLKTKYWDFAGSDPNIFIHHSKWSDNPFIDAAFKDRMEQRKRTDPEGYRIYGLGEWGEIGGLILKNFTLKEVPDSPIYYDDVVLAQDFGWNHANCILYVGFKDGKLHVIDELYVHEWRREKIEAEASKMFDKSLRMWCDSAMPEHIDFWRDCGWTGAKGVDKGGSNGSVLAQIDLLKQHEIIIHPRCVNTLKEIQEWKWQMDNTTGEYIDKPVPLHDDAMACLRYCVEDYRTNDDWFIASDAAYF